VTEARELATQLQLSQRLESVGRLAGGVAHDFNNFLMVVTGNAELLLRDVGPDDPARSALEQILAAGESAATLTRQLLAFGRRQDLRLGIADLDAIVSRAEPLLRRVVPANVDLVVRPGGGLGAIRADSGQLEQILMNLVVNARDAMPDGGQVTIETANQEVDEEQAHRRPPMPEGPYVMLAVTDAGTGMDEVTRSRAFEPFYTTKDQEQGTGLGLASVYGIVKQSGAFIWVESEPDRGTRFEILFPRISPPALEPAD
jgi:signal transduction histidine kinase